MKGLLKVTFMKAQESKKKKKKKGEKASVFLEDTTETMRECGNMDSRGHSDEVSDGSEEISLETGEDHPKPWTYNSLCRASEAERPFLWVWKAYCQAKE